jgi:hypothetical protein
MEEKIKKYINYIISVLVDETEIKSLSPSQKPYISFPWKKVLLIPNSKVRRIITYENPPVELSIYLYDNFNVDDYKITKLIWDEYKEILIDSVF